MEQTNFYVTERVANANEEEINHAAERKAPTVNLLRTGLAQRLTGSPANGLQLNSLPKSPTNSFGSVQRLTPALSVGTISQRQRPAMSLQVSLQR